MYTQWVSSSQHKIKINFKVRKGKENTKNSRKHLLQTRLKSINSLLDNNAKQIDITRSKIVSILTASSYQQCQEFIEKIKEKRFNKVEERQVRKLNILINKKEGGITWQSSQVFPAARAFPQVNNRQVTLAIRASQETNNCQADRLTPRTSPQASQEDSTLPQSTIYKAGNSQGLWADGTPSQSRSAISQAGSSLLSLGDSALPQSNLSQAGSPQASPVDSTLSPAGSELSQGSSSQSSLEDSALPQSNVSQAGNSQASPGDSTFSLVASELSQASSPPSSPEDSALLAESAVPCQTVRCSASLRSRQAGTTPGEVSTVPQGVSSQNNASQEAGSFPNRHSTLQGSSPSEKPNPKWVINLSSKPLTPPQRSVLAKGPNFAVTLSILLT